MNTIRLTMAQALVRHLAAQTHPHRRRRAAALPRRVRDLRPRQRRGPRRGAARRTASRCRRSARTTSRPWRMRRSPSRRRIDRRRMMACTTSVGPGRHQPRHRRGARARQPPAGAAAAGRHVREPPARPGAAASSRTSATRRSRPTTACGRCRGSGIASRARSSSSRRCRRRSPCCSIRPTAARRRSRCRRTCRPRPSTIPPASSRSACTTSSVRGRTASGSPRPLRRLKAARRPLIVAGGGVHYSGRLRGARGVRRAPRHPGRRNAGRQGRARLGPPVQRRRDRRHRLERREPAAGGMRPRARARHAAAGLHDRLGQADSRRRRPPRLDQRGAARRDQARRASPCAAIVLATLDGARARARRLAGRPAWRERDARARRRVERGGRRRDARGRRPADRRAGAGRRQPRARQGRDGRLRRGRAARRAAQALALRRSRAAITSSTATPAWATRSPAASA